MPKSESELNHTLFIYPAHNSLLLQSIMGIESLLTWKLCDLFQVVCACVYLRLLFWNGFVPQRLQSFHGCVVPSRLASSTFTNKLVTAYRQLHVEHFGDWIMIP